MNLKKLNKLLLIFVSSIILICCSKKPSISSDTLAYLKDGSGEWVLKIDDLTINQTNFNKDLKASLLSQGATEEQLSLYLNDNQYKQYYSEILIRDSLLLKKAEEENFFDSEDAKAILNLAIRNVKSQYYLQKLLEEASKTIPDPTIDQAKAFFEQVKPQLAQYNITEYNTETAPYVAQFYKNTYAQQIVEREISDLKDKAIIDRNTAILGEVSILPPQFGQPNTNTVLPQNDILPRTNN